MRLKAEELALSLPRNFSSANSLYLVIVTSPESAAAHMTQQLVAQTLALVWLLQPLQFTRQPYCNFTWALLLPLKTVIYSRNSARVLQPEQRTDSLYLYMGVQAFVLDCASSKHPSAILWLSITCARLCKIASLREGESAVLALQKCQHHSLVQRMNNGKKMYETINIEKL